MLLEVLAIIFLTSVFCVFIYVIRDTYRQVALAREAQVVAGEPSELAALLNSLQGHASLCQECGRALIETSAPLIAGKPTEYQRARANMIKATERSYWLTCSLRGRKIDPTLVRTDAAVLGIWRQCQDCPGRNAARQEAGQSFRCFVLQEGDSKRLRYYLDDEGNIIGTW